MRYLTTVLALMAACLLVVACSTKTAAPPAPTEADMKPQPVPTAAPTTTGRGQSSMLPMDGNDTIYLPWDDDQPDGRAASGGEYRGQAVRSLNTQTAQRSGPSVPRAKRGEELWVIAKPEVASAESPDRPGTGELAAKQTVEGKGQLVAIPLKHTDVKARIAGYISSTTVTQQFQNPYSEKIEAVYVFPLPENAAINEFVMTIGSRKIRGIIREREEAQKIYQEAKRQGYVASLLTQERPNVFTQSVANIEPGKQIDVQITYYHTLAYADGWYEWVFPMVVGPRYNPAGSTNGIGAAPVGPAGTTGQKTEVQYLKPSQRSGHDISLSLELTCPAGLEDVRSTSHQIDVRQPDSDRAVIAIKPADRLPNKDFVLRYRAAGDQVKSGLVLHRGDKGGYFSLMVYPPLDVDRSQRERLEMVFLLDVSGSMSGAPIEQSKAAMRYALANMDSSDTFQVITFSGSDRRLFDVAKPVTKENIARAMKFVEETNAGGGTEMLKGIASALDGSPEEGRRRVVVFLTDGFVGNETDILRLAQEKLNTARIFAFGVGSSPNRYLMDGLARVGRGAVAYLGLRDSGEEVMRLYFQRVSRPAMTNLQVDFGQMHASQLYPPSLPDLFVGRPVVLTGRYSGELPRSIKVTGRVAGKPVSIEVPVDSLQQKNPALAAVWARHRITDLSDQMLAPGAAEEIAKQLKDTALEYGLMSQFTAYIAVDSSEPTAGAHGTTVAVPVPVPEGVKYETTVKER